MPDSDVVVRGTTLSLRAARDLDRQRWFEAHTDPAQVALGTPDFIEPPASPADLDEPVADSRDHLRERAPGTLVIVGNDDPDRLLGLISWRLDSHPGLGVADVGYSVHPDARRRGVAGGALTLMVRWLLHDEDGPGMARVQLDHSVENLASCRTALAARLVKEGVRRGFLPLRDAAAPGGVRRHDVCLHGVVRDA